MTRLAQVKAELAAVTRESWANHMALTLALTEKPDHTEKFRLDSWRYVVRAYGLKRADGGYVVVRGSYVGQRDSIHAYHFLDCAEKFASSPVEFKIAIERIGVAQRKLLDREVAR